MKNLMLLIFLIAASCSKKAPETTMSEKPEVLDYDTTAIDSFAPGATPANMLTKKVIIVKDSAKEAKKKLLEAQIKELEKKELEKKKAEEKQKSKDKEKQKALETSLPTEQSAI